MLHGNLSSELIENFSLKQRISQTSHGQDLGTVNANLITAMINLSGAQFQVAMNYINEYNTANAQLTTVTGTLSSGFANVLNMTVVNSFISNISDHLNGNVQELITKYSPGVVYSYILNSFQNFLNNLILNNGTQTEINDMNQIYYGKFFNPNATDCITKYNDDYYNIYASAAADFIKLVEGETNGTVRQLDSMTNDLQTLIGSLVGSFENIISNPLSALQLFDLFVWNLCWSLIGEITTSIAGLGQQHNNHYPGWQLDFAVRQHHETDTG